MFDAHSINAEHKDLIHDIAYDFYGQRMATCSSDQFVKVNKITLNQYYFLLRRVTVYSDDRRIFCT